MRSGEEEYKMIKIKKAIKLYSNEDVAISVLRTFENNSARQGHQSLVEEATTFADVLWIILSLRFPYLMCRDKIDGADVPRDTPTQEGCIVAAEN